MSSKPKHEEKSILISELKEFPGNPNVHPIDQVKAIAESMEKYGQYYPIICDEQLQILCGHGKKMALELRGEKKAKVTILHGLTDKQKMKLLIEDNKIQDMSYVNFPKVEEIIKQIGDLDIIGFSTEYLDAIINEVSKDNMGVDFTQKPETKESFTEEKSIADKNEMDSIEKGMQQARAINCPHCGKEIIM